MSDWSRDLVKLPAEAPSVPAHTRTGTAKAGTPTAPMRPCRSKPDAHGFHPSDEACPYCPPPPPLVAPERDETVEYEPFDVTTLYNLWP